MNRENTAEPTPPPTLELPVTPWWRVLVAPVTDVCRPGAAARCLDGASHAAWLAVLVLSLLTYAALLIALALWYQTVTLKRNAAPMATTTMAATTTAVGAVSFGPPELQSRTFRQVWDDWHAEFDDTWLGPSHLIVILTFALGTCFVLSLAWLNLPLVHAVGSPWPSYRRAIRAATALLWPLTALTLITGIVLVSARHAYCRGAGAFPGSGAEVAIPTMACVSVSLVLLIAWSNRAALAIAVGAPALALPPRCEGCGYDLTHQPESGRCTECGLELGTSLVQSQSRPGNPWLHDRSLRAWAHTTRWVLLDPRMFYRRLRLRTSPAAEAGYATVQFVLLGAGAALWAIGMVLIVILREGLPPTDEWWLIVGAGAAMILNGLCACWLGHRVLGAFVISAWIAQRALPDFRWVAKVLAYESAFLWVFCASWGLLLSTFVTYNNWISALLGSSGDAAETLTILVGTLLLVGVWLWRYSIAYRSIRWSNF